ncbi:Uu.00g073550.m01.CDS01 [Anthostomella pinea]|uniref:Uu.00g073550.m01.CDS01 n=1 Tax=Anthostomella pinea TaxID=933095 RepID=A0AAI8VW66_9PEZI|nr:Uu.00g073550.m01.CDS01 [Anthostomella pinea]
MFLQNLASWIAFSLAVPLAAAFQKNHPSKNDRGPDQVIMDTDMILLDDPMALQVMLEWERVQEDKTQLKAVNINADSKYSAMMTWEILKYYAPDKYNGHDKLPVGLRRPVTDFKWNPTTFRDLYGPKVDIVGEIASKIGADWSGSESDVEEKTEDPVKVYEDMLEKADDQTVTILSIGFFDNLYEFMQKHENRELIKKKVWRMLVMGGDKTPSGSSHNFYAREDGHPDPSNEAAKKTAFVFNNWPSEVPIYFSGLGKNELVGVRLLEATGLDQDPIRRAIVLYNEPSELLTKEKPVHSCPDVTLAFAVGDVDEEWFEDLNPHGKLNMIEKNGEYDGSYEWDDSSDTKNNILLGVKSGETKDFEGKSLKLPDEVGRLVDTFVLKAAQDAAH